MQVYGSRTEKTHTVTITITESELKALDHARKTTTIPDDSAVYQLLKMVTEPFVSATRGN